MHRHLRNIHLIAPWLAAVAISLLVSGCNTASNAPSGGTKVATSDDLATVVAGAPAGAILDLQAGTFKVTGLVIDKSLSLVGAGVGKTIIEGQPGLSTPSLQSASAFGNPVLYVDGGTFSMKGVTVEYTGTAESDVAVIQNAKVNISNSRFTGGVNSSSTSYLGDGLNIGHSTGSLSTITSDGNQWNGVTIVQSTIDMASSTVASNGASGIVVVGGGGTIDGNDVHGNPGGIALVNGTNATVKNNSVHDNTYDGIIVADTSAPKVVGNTSQHNGASGVNASGTSAPDVDANTLSGNGFAGVDVVDDATPTIRNNTITGNAASGIEFHNGGGGTATGNTVNGNAHSGIWLIDTASPTLESNTINGNQWDGVTYNADAAGTASNSDVGANGFRGIALFGSASPSLQNNEVHGGPQSGIAYEGTASGTATGNNVHDNAHNGIAVLYSAAPSVTGNDTSNNGECGVLSAASASPTVSSNTYAGNGVNGSCLLVASSRDDFSGTQGQNGWSYGYYDGSSNTPYTNGDFQQLPSYDSSQQIWSVGNLTISYTEVGQVLMHPNGGTAMPSESLQWAVRRWTSGVSGSVTLFGHLYKIDTTTCSSCDGVTGHVLTGDASIWSKSIAPDDATGVSFALPINVSVGSTVDFAVSPNTTNNADGSGMWVDVLKAQ